MPDTAQPPFFEPLRAMDRQFLAMESANLHMHVSGLSLYPLEPLRDEVGGVEFQTFRKAIAAALDRIPRYRQRLHTTPIARHPVWVDAADFDLDDHLLHVALPSPGSDAQLKMLVGWIVSQRLDPARPLWEMWIVEGIGGDEHFAVVTKMHHCMLDGGAGVNLMQLLLSATPERRLVSAKAFEPRPLPDIATLAAYDLERAARTPLRIADRLRRLAADDSGLLSKLGQGGGAVGGLLRNALPASRTPISRRPLGPRRCVDWFGLSLEDISALRRRLGCTLNDLVLAIVAGGLRRYLLRRSVELDGLDFRVSIPVNVRRKSEAEEMGNRTSSWIVPLPLAESDPLVQLDAIERCTREQKSSHQAVAVEWMMAAAEELPLLLDLGAAAMQGQVSLVVTNVPGPPIPLYLLGCRALSMQPLVPLIPGVGVGIAVLSYDGTLYWGLQADADLVPDLTQLSDDLRAGCAALAAVAPVEAEVSGDAEAVSA
jgi:diacylglycerol O-acyltransferase